MARERYLIGVDPADLEQPKTPPPPMTPKQKWIKFWYNYRWAVVFAVVVVVLSVAVGLLVGSREKVDYTLVVVTKGILTEDARAEIAEEMEISGQDLDGDGSVNVQVIQLAMTDPGDYVELSSIFSGGSALLFAMEPTYYETQIAELETEDSYYFCELNVEHPGLSENGRYWNWKGSLCQKYANASFPADLYFGVRLPIGTASGAKNEQISADCVALLEHFIADNPIA